MRLRLAFALLLLCPGSAAFGQAIAPPYNTTYTLQDLGSVPGVPTTYGGVCFLNNNTMLIGGAANTAAGTVHQINVIRNASQQITGFAGTATLYKNAPNIDGGLAFGTGGVLFATGFPTDTLMQFKPGGGINPDKTVNLAPLGIASVGTVQFVPSGFPGAGGIRILGWPGGGFYTANLVPDGMGTYDVTGVTLQVTTLGGPEGLVYVPPGSPVFNPANLHCIISEFSAGKVSTYQLDAAGIPIVGTRADFVTGLTGAEGAVLDPVTNDFLFSTFGGTSRVIRVSGFAAPPPPTPPGGGGREGSFGGSPGPTGAEGSFGFGGGRLRAALPVLRGPIVDVNYPTNAGVFNVSHRSMAAATLLSGAASDRGHALFAYALFCALALGVGMVLRPWRRRG